MRTDDAEGDGPTIDRRAALTLLSGSVALLASAGAPAAAQTERGATKAPPLAVMRPVAEYIAASGRAPIPDDVRLLGRLHILDTLASVVACRDFDAAKVGRAFSAARGGMVRKGATILGTNIRTGLVDAAFAGAMTAHAAEINDFIPSALVQPGPSIVSAALAIAETRGGSGKAALNAVITGYELAGRMPKALGVGNLQASPLANHGIGPVFGVAATAASMMGFTVDQIEDVLSACVQQASGSWQWLLDVQHIEKAFVFAGMGARNGLEAALLVEAGYRGVPDCLDRPSGWMLSKAFTGGDAKRSYLIDDLGIRFEMAETGFKCYPVGGPTQPAVEALLQLLPKVDRAKVERVTIEMPGRADAFRDAAMPALNLKYLAAIILIDGKLDFTSAQSMRRFREDPMVAALMTRVDVLLDPSQEHKAGEARTESARVTIASGGTKEALFVPYVRGFPSHPMTTPDVEAKALELMAPRIGKARAQAVVDRVANIEHEVDASVFGRLIAS